MVHVQSFTFNPFQENTYVVWSDGDARCFVLDPGCYERTEVEQLTTFVKNKGLQVTDIVCTHCHIDHVFGLDALAEAYRVTPAIPPGEVEMLKAVGRVAEMYGLQYAGTPEVKMLAQDEVELAGMPFDVLAVPGHSPGHVALYHSAAGILLAGDVLFRRSIGRTDLPGGDHDTLLRSIRGQLFVLPDEVVVYPGHMEPTTIGEEKQHNPFF